jgi:hypothetical protein
MKASDKNSISVLHILWYTNIITYTYRIAAFLRCIAHKKRQGALGKRASRRGNAAAAAVLQVTGFVILEATPGLEPGYTVLQASSGGIYGHLH